MPASASSRRCAGEADPEAKRKIIGGVFIEVFDEEAAQARDVELLAQGTIYPDVIESAGAKTGKAHVIKSHHNVGGLPANMKLKLLEPLRELFKDEVRKLGRRARSAARDGVPPSVPRSRASACASSARYTSRTRICCAARMRFSSRNCGAHDLYDKRQPGVRGVPAGALGRSRAFRRDITWIALMESPPRSKKLSCTPTRSAFNNACQISASACSASFLGAT